MIIAALKRASSVGVDAAARIQSSSAGPIMMRNIPTHRDSRPTICYVAPQIGTPSNEAVTTYQNSDDQTRNIPARTKSIATINTTSERTVLPLIAATFFSATKRSAAAANENTPGMKRNISPCKRSSIRSELTGRR